MDADDLMRENEVLREPTLLYQWLGCTRKAPATSRGLSLLLSLLILKGLGAGSVYRSSARVIVKVLDFIKSGGPL